MNPDRSTAELVAVEHAVISIGAKVNGEFSFEQFLLVLFDRTGERMVHRNITTTFLIKGQQGELGDPEEIQFGVVFEKFLHFGRSQTHTSQNLANLLPWTSAEKNQVTGLNVERFFHRSHFGFREEFCDRRAPSVHGFAARLDVGQTFGSSLDRRLGE